MAYYNVIKRMKTLSTQSKYIGFMFGQEQPNTSMWRGKVTGRYVNFI